MFFRKEPTTKRTSADVLAGLSKIVDELKEVCQLQTDEARKQSQIAIEAEQAEKNATAEAVKAQKVLDKMQDLLCIGQ